MSAIGLVNLAQNLSNQDTTLEQPAQPAQQLANTQAIQQSQRTQEDQFTPSSQSGPAQATAQAAGLFSVSQSTLFSPAANAVLGQNSARPANVTSIAPAQATPAVAATATTTAATTAATTSLASTQEQLQALNLALVGLGLSTQDIQQLDQVASTINDYNPSAYTARAYQLEALAQQATPAPANASLTTNSTNTAAAKAEVTGATAATV